MEIISWTKKALEKKIKNSLLSGDRDLAETYSDLLFLYDLKIIDIQWKDGLPQFNKIKKFKF